MPKILRSLDKGVLHFLKEEFGLEFEGLLVIQEEFALEILHLVMVEQVVLGPMGEHT